MDAFSRPGVQCGSLWTFLLYPLPTVGTHMAENYWGKDAIEVRFAECGHTRWIALGHLHTYRSV
jgi:hypothetical protein